MSNKLLFIVAAAALVFSIGAKAQTNFQTFYDFGSDRGHFTTTLEGFHQDGWGNTFFFIDYDYNNKVDGRVISPNGTYFEIARCLNFWQNSALSPFSWQIEYNGGVYAAFPVNNAFLTGVDCFMHSAGFRNTLNLKVLYKHIMYADKNTRSNLPLQFTAVWGLRDLFGVTGLSFSGFADFWWEEHGLFADKNGTLAAPETSHFVFLSEPQLWYNVGRHFGVKNLNVGGEVELSYDFGSSKGFWVRPCVGTKWVF